MLLWSVQKYLLLWRKEYLSYSFSEKRCIFQGGGLISTILCKSIIYYQILTVQSRKLKKLQRDDRFNMKNKSWNCCISLNEGSRVIHFRIRISWSKSEQKSGFILISCLFLNGTSLIVERDSKLFRRRCQNFTLRILSGWLYEDITCSGLLINKKQKTTDTKKKSHFLRKWKGRILEFCFFMSIQI